MSKDTYGVDTGASGYVDVSNTERGAKNYATRHGHDKVYIRANHGCFTDLVAKKQGKRWVDVTAISMREDSQESGRKFRVVALSKKSGQIMVMLFELNGHKVINKIASELVWPPMFRREPVEIFRYVVSAMFDDVCRRCESTDPELYDALQVARAEIDRRARERKNK